MRAVLDLPSFRHGVHPRENKERTEQRRIERMPFVDRYVIHLGQHIGAPSRPLVQPGQRVERGEPIAEPGSFVSTSYHSPVTGRIRAIGPQRHANGSFVPSIEIEADRYATQRFEPRAPIDWRGLSGPEFVSSVQQSGMVGLGGAAFPSHVKYAVPAGKKVERFVLNGCECEPFLTCDHRVMVERPEAVLRGTGIVAAKIGAEASDIGVEANKMEAVHALNRCIGGLPVKVHPLKVKYPQGAEKMLIQSIYGREVPAGSLPLDIGMIVNNAHTMAAIADWFDTGLPLIERVITVSGPAVRQPANLLTPIGTPIRAVLEHCGGLRSEVSQVIMGGPMMGFTVASLDAPILKGTSGILAFTAAETAWPEEHTCIRCARCLEACPYFLNPARLGKLARARRHEEARAYHVMDCMECGACSYACPSAIPLVQLIRVSKQALRESGGGK